MDADLSPDQRFFQETTAQFLEARPPNDGPGSTGVLAMPTGQGWALSGTAMPVEAGRRAGRLHELGWTATWMCSPYAAYLSGHTLVLDGANWLRRGLRMPQFTDIREQMGAAFRPPKNRRTASAAD